MRFIILFEDNPDADPNIREAHMAGHLSFLEDNAHKIRAAGPLSKSSGEAAGGLWLVDAETERDVERLVRDDPFWPTGLRKSFSIFNWNQVYADGTRLIHPD